MRILYLNTICCLIHKPMLVHSGISCVDDYLNLGRAVFVFHAISFAVIYSAEVGCNDGDYRLGCLIPRLLLFSYAISYR